jgi:hypothetical protein
MFKLSFLTIFLILLLTKVLGKYSSLVFWIACISSVASPFASVKGTLNFSIYFWLVLNIASNITVYRIIALQQLISFGNSSCGNCEFLPNVLIYCSITRKFVFIFAFPNSFIG